MFKIAAGSHSSAAAYAEHWRPDVEARSSGSTSPRPKGWAAGALGLTQRLCWPARALAAWAALLLLVHLLSGDPAIAAFPDACAPAKLDGCSRIAAANPNRTGGLQPLHVVTSRAALLAAARAWMQAQPRVSVLRSDASLVHARAVSFAWGFADDVVVQVRCGANGSMAVLEAQSALRLGRSDFSVNSARLAVLWEHISGEAQRGALPHLPC
ncbi:hypothetical protein WJX81_006791 [Elliptochloris bilobata]|uniref:DUF1499 domain-containing protein n=1 Tax=Elliptochloris bilobata TaxID=381761 RepID=A0AAW1QCW5_9CHLO